MELVFLLVACLFNEMLSPCSLDPHNIINCLKKKSVQKTNKTGLYLLLPKTLIK